MEMSKSLWVPSQLGATKFWEEDSDSLELSSCKEKLKELQPYLEMPEIEAGTFWMQSIFSASFLLQPLPQHVSLIISKYSIRMVEEREELLSQFLDRTKNAQFSF